LATPTPGEHFNPALLDWELPRLIETTTEWEILNRQRGKGSGGARLTVPEAPGID